MTPVSVAARLALLGALLAQPLAAQAPLSLREAFRRVDAHAYGNRIARARADAAAGRVGTAMRGILPTVRAEAGWMRSTDPLAAFGDLMRQRLVTPQAFDPASLNSPAARSDLSTGVVLEAPLLNPDAWAGRTAAKRAAGTEAANAEWIASGLRLDVIRAYFGAVLASEQVATLAGAAAAARAHVRDAESAVTNGVATRSDALLAAVKEGEIETQLASARGQLSIARLQLALLLGSPGDTAFALPEKVPHALSGAPDSPSAALRADLRTASAALDAARAAGVATDLSMLPRLNGFARYDWHDPRSLLGGKAMWTVGVMASWSPFSGGAELAQRRVAQDDVQAAQAAKDGAEASATVERQSADIGVAVATRALDIAAAAVSQSTEAHRIVGRKYQGGLATVTELLDAQAAELATRLAESKARYEVLVARAVQARASGSDLTTIAAALDQAAGPRE
jgi:outer membrane protein TolC